MLFGFLSKSTPKGLDSDKILSGEFGKKLIDYLTEINRTDKGNAIYPSNILGIFHRMDFFHWMYNMKINECELTENSRLILEELKINFGNEPTDEVTRYYTQPQKYLAMWFKERFVEILDQYALRSNQIGNFYFNNKTVRFDFNHNSLNQ